MSKSWLVKNLAKNHVDVDKHMEDPSVGKVNSNARDISALIVIEGDNQGLTDLDMNPNTQETSLALASASTEYCSEDRHLIIARGNDMVQRRVYWPSKSYYIKDLDIDDDVKLGQNASLIDHAWSKRILELVGNKVKLMESFSWLSTVGGGFSSLGESDQSFSSRAGALSLGQQLQLAELLGDERLRVMCHLFAALAALQMNNKKFCWYYIKRVILPLIHAMPYRDPLLTNILMHIWFRMNNVNRFIGARRLLAKKSIL